MIRSWLPLIASLLAPATALAMREVSATLPDFVDQVRTFMPQEGSNGYVVPTDEERNAFAAAARAASVGDVSHAEKALAPLTEFELIHLKAPSGDPATGYLVLAEKLPMRRGWGFFFFADAPTRPSLIVEAPHPHADKDSELAAARTATQLRPASFLLAGAHRYAALNRQSDVAHAPVSIFETVHETVMAADRIALQIHGFSPAGHAGYPELLLSAGVPTSPPEALAMCDRITAGGVQCKVFDGQAYVELGATSNVQGGFSRRTFGDGHFFHFETAESLRLDLTRFDPIIQAMSQQFPPPRGGGCSTAGTAAPFPLLCCWLASRRRRFSRGVK